MFSAHIPSVTCPNCVNRQHYGWAYPVYPTSNEKCDLCGSTAIDHTEQQCNLNRSFNQIKPKDNIEDKEK